MKRLHNYGKGLKKDQIVSKLQTSKEGIANKTINTLSSTLTLTTNFNYNLSSPVLDNNAKSLQK
jgi:hypothetical protein